VWNSAAEDLWGLRTEEVQGRYLLNLDMGLPLSRLHPLLRRQTAREGAGAGGHDTLELDAVNRRGRPVRVRVTVTRFTGAPGEQPGAVVLMDPVDA
jgi:two-component system, chemotaxis family, CheB/CheR fusion protein